MKELLEQLRQALEAGLVSEAEVNDLLARASARRKQATLDKVAKRLDEGMTEDEVMAALEKRK